LLTSPAQYWDSITREDLEFSVGTKQGNWEVKEPFLDPSIDDYRSYDASSLDYSVRPTSAHQFGRSRENLSFAPPAPAPGYGNLIEARQSYGDGDVSLKKTGVYDEVVEVQPRMRERREGSRFRDEASRERKYTERY